MKTSSLLSAFCAAVLLPFLSLADSADGDKKAKEPTPKPCTIRSPTSGHFFDLNPISVRLPDSKDKKKADESLESWHAKGYDYGTNFTLNFCAPVVEELDDVEGLDRNLWRNVSAYYRDGRRTYSIGWVPVAIRTEEMASYRVYRLTCDVILQAAKHRTRLPRLETRPQLHGRFAVRFSGLR